MWVPQVSLSGTIGALRVHFVVRPWIVGVFEGQREDRLRYPEEVAQKVKESGSCRGTTIILLHN